MKFLINKSSQADINDFGVDGLLEGADGGFYSYQVEFGTNPGGLEEVAISDGCNRYIPVAIENVPALVAALNECMALNNEIKMAENLTEMVESDNEAYVDSIEIQYNS